MCQEKNNPVADALYIIQIIQLTTAYVYPLKGRHISNRTSHRTAIKSLQIEDKELQGTSHTIVCDVSTGTARPYVPTKLRKRLFENLHSLSHPGIRAPKETIVCKFCMARFS